MPRFLTSQGKVYEMTRDTEVAPELADRAQDIHYTGHNNIGVLVRFRKGGWSFATTASVVADAHASITNALGDLPSEHFSPKFNISPDNKELFAANGGLKGYDCYFIWIEPADGSLKVPDFKAPKLD